MRRDDQAQLQLLEAILAAIFIFIAIAVAAIYRLPTSPQTFQESELQNVGLDALKVRQAAAPTSNDDCNETPCAFSNSLDRMLSLALGYVGRTAGSGEAPDASELRGFLDQALPPGSRHLVVFSNGVNQTILTPVGLTPPLSPVSVARILVSPNWTTYASQIHQGVLVRIHEATELTGLVSVHDPLNRTQTEFGTPWASLYGNRVPPNATYGTHYVCESSGCGYMTVVPSTVPPAGSFVTSLDRSMANVVSLGTLTDTMRFWDTGSAGLGTGDVVYIDADQSGTVGEGDVRLGSVTGCRGATACRGGTFVRNGDADIGRTLSLPPQPDLRVQSSDATISEDDEIWLLRSGTSVAAGDVRLTRMGLLPIGSHATTSASTSLWIESDVATVDFADLDADGLLDEGEPVYLNLREHGQTAAVEVNDVFLTTVGEPTPRYPYDVKLVVWYGV